LAAGWRDHKNPVSLLRRGVLPFAGNSSTDAPEKATHFLVDMPTPGRYIKFGSFALSFSISIPDNQNN
jgi:hypothetical protein